MYINKEETIIDETKTIKVLNKKETQISNEKQQLNCILERLDALEKYQFMQVEKKKFSKGILLWVLILLAYFIFIFNWMVMDSMGGSVENETGWIYYFFGENGKEPSIILTQSVNYTITFMRGMGAFLAGWVLVKVGHKKSIYIAMGALLFGIIAPWVQLYSLFVISRMIMAIGGTTLIVYTQPIIANYFRKEGTKTRLNAFNCLACNFGLIFAIAPFIFWSDGLTENWQYYSTGFATLAIIFLVLYIIFGEDIDLETVENPEDANITYKSVLKEKRTWLFSLAYIFWLPIGLFFMIMVTKYFIIPFNPYFAPEQDGDWIIPLYKIVFLSGLFFGVIIFKFIQTGTYSRKPLIVTILTVGVFAMLISVMLMAFTGSADGEVGDPETTYSTSILWLVVAMILIFISEVCIGGVQGIILGMTYEYEGATPKKQGILLGFLWGIAYMSYSLLSIILSAFFGIQRNPELDGELGPGVSSTGEIVGCIFFFIFAFLSPITFLFVEETHKGNNFFKVKYNSLKNKLTGKSKLTTKS